MIVSLLLTGAAWQTFNIIIDQVARGRIGTRADSISAIISHRMLEQEQVLRSGVGLINAMGFVDHTRWRTFVNSLELERAQPGQQGYAYSVIVHARDKATHVDSIRKTGFPDYDIWPRGERAIYSPVVNMEPFRPQNRIAIGYDMYSEPVRSAAMEQARDTGAAAATGVVLLLNETEKDRERGIVIYLPVYRTGTVPATIDERRADLIGFVLAPFRINNLMRGVISASDSVINVKIYDGNEKMPQTLLFDNAENRTVGTADYIHEIVIQVGGRPWTLQFATEKAKFVPLAFSVSLVIGLGGLITSLLLYFFMRLRARQRRTSDKAAAMRREIQRSGERYRAVVDTAADAIVLADDHGIITSFNRAAETIFGYAAHEVLGRSVHVLMAKDLANTHDAAMQRYLETRVGRVVGIGREVEGRRNDGILFPLHLSLASWRSGPNEVGFTAIMRDITEEKNAQRALEKSEHQLQTIMDCATDFAIYQVNLNRRIIKWNKGTEHILGYSAEELDGLQIDQLFPVEDLREGIPGKISANAIRCGRQETECWQVRKDGRIFWGSGVVQPIYDGSRVIGLTVVLRDMTSQRAAAELQRLAKEQAETAAWRESELRARIEASNQELRSANEGLQKFASIVAHDLRSPLKRIDAFINALREDYASQIDADGNEIMTRINRCAVRMKLMLDSMLDYSRYNAKAFSGKTADLAAVINGVIENCDFQGFESGVKVNIQGVVQLPGDSLLLAHVFQNLIGNAIKFRRGEDLRVDIDVTPGLQEVCVSVTDNGIGIEPQFADRVFDMFCRLHNEDEYEGTGIGLTVCRKIVNDHGGRIWVDKAYEDGARIVMTLPAANECAQQQPSLNAA